MKKYTKYEYIVTQTKMEAISNIIAFVLIAILFLVAGLSGLIKGFQNENVWNPVSIFSLIIFALNMPILRSSIKKYKKLQAKIRETAPEDIEKDPDFKSMIYTKKQLILFVVLLGMLLTAIIALAILMIWLMLNFYATDFLVCFIFLCTLAIYVAVPTIRYLCLIPIIEKMI